MTDNRKSLIEYRLTHARDSIREADVLNNGGMSRRSIMNRLYQASKLAGCATIPAVFTDGEPAEISIIENLLRENLTAIEEAEAIDRLKTQHNYQLSDLSVALGKSDSTLTEILSLNKLPDEVKNDCRYDPKTARGILVEITKKKDRPGNDDRPVHQIQGKRPDTWRNPQKTTYIKTSGWTG